jgi:hypothetical protein
MRFIHTYPPMKMEPIQCSETSAYNIQTPGNYPEGNILHPQDGESLKTTRLFSIAMARNFERCWFFNTPADEMEASKLSSLIAFAIVSAFHLNDFSLFSVNFETRGQESAGPILSLVWCWSPPAGWTLAYGWRTLGHHTRGCCVLLLNSKARDRTRPVEKWPVTIHSSRPPVQTHPFKT